MADDGQLSLLLLFGDGGHQWFQRPMLPSEVHHWVNWPPSMFAGRGALKFWREKVTMLPKSFSYIVALDNI